MHLSPMTWKQNGANGKILFKICKVSRDHVHLPHSTTNAQRRGLCVFADASVKAIAAVAYIKVSTLDNTEVGFEFGKTKLAPQAGLTIPRLEFCAAVLAVEVAELIVAEMDITFDNFEYYTDSKVVLGYIYNQSQRFYVYVHNRVQSL